LLWEAKPEIDLREQSPVALAFVGDGILEALVRTRLVERTRLAPSRLHAAAVHFVCAKSQCIALEHLEPLLTQEEQNVVRRGKNATKAAVAKHATPREYRASTALEALFGWLYLRNQKQRVEELFELVWESLSPSLGDALAKKSKPAKSDAAPAAAPPHRQP